MRTLPTVIGLALCAAIASAAAPARAAFHLWDIKEIFSNADGTVQFIEFFTSSGSQQSLDGHPIIASSDLVPVTFTLSGNLPVTPPQTTANRHFLVATAGFAALQGGVMPDYSPLPSNFFNPNAASISIDFAHGFDAVTFAGSLLPKDGVNSLTDQAPNGVQNLVAGVNSPTNFAGASGSVNLAPTFLAGDFDEDGAVDADDLNNNWRTGYGMQGAAVDHNDGDADDDNDVDGGDYLVWQRQLGSGPALPAAGAIPEPATGLLLALAALPFMSLRRAARRAAGAPPV